jgi:hypothetical protein
MSRVSSPRSEAAVASGTSTVEGSSVLTPEVRRAIAAAAEEMRSGRTLPYPPNEEARLTDEELSALAKLHLEPAARSALRKIVRAAASSPLFQLFALLDAVADPELTRDVRWMPIDLSPSQQEQREMMHDEFYDSFRRYAERRLGPE